MECGASAAQNLRRSCDAVLRPLVADATTRASGVGLPCVDVLSRLNRRSSSFGLAIFPTLPVAGIGGDRGLDASLQAGA